jgi:hypothetical protein
MYKNMYATKPTRAIPAKMETKLTALKYGKGEFYM